jgi:hypothetical protein
MLPIQTFLAQEIFEDLEAALKQFREIAADLSGNWLASRELTGKGYWSKWLD